MADRKPWRCPDCGAMVAPHVNAHWCDGPDGGVGAKRPGAPSAPFPPAAVTYPLPAGTIVAGGGGGSSFTGTTVTITAKAGIGGRDLFQAVQQETLRYDRRQGRPPRAA